MGIIGDVLKEQINKDNSQSYTNATGVILKYNSVTNTATVRFKNPNGEGYLTLKQVPVSLSNGGLSGFNGILENKECNLNFINASVFSPIITGVYDNFYSDKTMEDQGCFLVNQEILDIEKPENITPMVDDWLDTNNEIVDKYNNDYSEYLLDRDVDSYCYDVLRNISHFKDTEQGIINIVNNSGIKIKENGDIDIFIDNNSGIKISSSTKTIRIFGLEIIKD